MLVADGWPVALGVGDGEEGGVVKEGRGGVGWTVVDRLGGA
jgi:hypothetical protein